MTPEPTSGCLCVAVLALMALVSSQTVTEPDLRIAQLRVNEGTPGGVEHQPSIEPYGGAAPAAVPQPAPEMSAPAAPAIEAPEAPAVVAPSETEEGTHKKEETTKPAKASKTKSKKYQMKAPAEAPSKEDNGSGADERRPGGVEHAPTTGE